MAKHQWAYPKGRDIWVIFDLSNGDPASRCYLWWFETRTEALAWRRERLGPKFAEFSLPMKYRRAQAEEKK